MMILYIMTLHVGIGSDALAFPLYFEVFGSSAFKPNSVNKQAHNKK